MLSKPDFLEATRRYKNKKLNAHLKLRSEVKGFEQGGLSRYLLSK